MKHDCRFAESREESVNSVTVICISILRTQLLHLTAIIFLIINKIIRIRRKRYA